MKIIPNYDDWSEEEILAGLILGEASGESKEGKVAVAHTVKTRVEHPRWWGNSYRSVCLCYSPKTQSRPAVSQFSCWLDVNASRIKKEKDNSSIIWKQCLVIANGIIHNIFTCNLDRPTHYHTLTCFPDWSSKMLKLDTIEHHIFYRDISEKGLA